MVSKSSKLYRPDSVSFSSSGKEKDSETGLSYFGARYYEPEMLNIWLSVDPMADKYPSLSPYNYCAWNPIKLVDPDGEEIWIKGLDGHEYQYKDGKLYNKDGSAYAGDDKFASQTLSDLNTLKDNGMYDQIASLEQSENIHRIKMSDDGLNTITPVSDANASNGIGCNTTIKYDQNKLKEDGWQRPAVVGLAHEMQHAFDMDKGIYNNELVFYTVITICSPFENGAKLNDNFGIYTRREERWIEKGEYNAVITANLVNKNINGNEARPRTRYNGYKIEKLKP